jgi:hypothetical protein
MGDLAGRPHLSAMNIYMSIFKHGLTYPVEERLGNGLQGDPETVFMVDVGGGHGNQAITLKRTFPHLPSRFVVQDLAMEIPTERPTDVA